MFKYCVVPLFLIINFHTLKIWAFDPFTVMGATNTTVSFLSSIKDINDTAGNLSEFSDVLGIATETLDESSSLASELGYESNSVDLDKRVEKLQNLNSKLKDIKWNSDELKYTLDSDINNTKSLAQKIKQMRKIISISKKLAGAFGLKTKGSDKVATLQQVKVSSMMLDELQALRQVQLVSYLEDKERIAKQDIYLNKLLNEESLNLQKMRRTR